MYLLKMGAYHSELGFIFPTMSQREAQMCRLGYPNRQNMQLWKSTPRKESISTECSALGTRITYSRGFAQKSWKIMFSHKNYALEWFSDSQTAPIRSAIKFCFDLVVRKKFQLFIKIFFRSIQRWKLFFEEKNLNKNQNLKFENFEN